MMLRDITPPAMLGRVAEICAERADVETLSYILGNERLLEWVHSVGVSTDEKLRDLAPPVPPLELRRIVAAPSESVFLWSGLKDAEMCAGYVERYVQHKRSASDERIRILDFGCGCGRTTRFLQGILQFDVHGSDVNKRLVGWCQDNLKMVTTIPNETEPPLSFSDGVFDVAYSLSIFTHLSEQSMLAWLDELARVTAAGGVVLLTTHGYAALETVCRSRQHQEMFQMSENEAEELRSTFDARRFSYRRYSGEVIKAADAGDEYGITFIHEAYIKERWSRSGFDVLEFVPGGLRGWQDVTILRRRAAECRAGVSLVRGGD